MVSAPGFEPGCTGSNPVVLANKKPKQGNTDMYTKIVEGHLEPLWLKVIVGTYEPEEVKQNSALPGYTDMNLMQAMGTTQPDDIWILDLSTGEGATFNLQHNTEDRVRNILANL